MKKTLIALAVAGLSFNASAVTLSKVTTGAVAPTAYASEINFPQELTNAVVTGATGLNIGFKFGFSASEGVKRYVRIELTNAEFVAGSFATAPLVGVSGIATDLTAVVDQKISNGGAGKNFVIVEVSPKTGQSIANDAVLALVINKVKALSADGVTAQYRLYETATAAFEATDVTLASDSGTLFTTKSGVVANFADGDEKKIDVGADSKQFDSAGTSTVNDKELANFTFAPVADVKAISGADIALADLYATATLALNGNFAAVKDAGEAAPKAANFTLDGTGATTLNAEKATFDLASNLTAGIEDKALAYKVDGETVLDIDTISGEIQVTAADAAKYNVANLPLDTILVEKNGGSATLNLVMKPGANYRHFVRITNKDEQEGRFFVTLFNDAGQSASVRLDAINLGTADEPANLPATIKGGASTKQILIDKIYDAVVAENPSFAVSGEKKLRVEVSGEVPQGKVSAQSYVVSTNNNALVKFD